MGVMRMGMSMDDSRVGAMMGMSAGEHREMLDRMQALRADVERLRSAMLEEMRQRMPEHLDHLEAMVQMMEASAAHMRGMAGMPRGG
jgi:hypothetical protein